MCSNNQQEEKNIIEFFNKDTFVKVKPAFNIGKILFSFVKWKPDGSIEYNTDCYISIADAGLLAHKITDGRLYKMLEMEKAKGQQYPAGVWKSQLGGVNERDAKAKGLRNDGKAVSRFFEIAPGASKYCVFTATTCAGNSNAQGLIVPDIKDPQKKVVRVSLASWDDVEKFGIMLEAAVNAYMNYACNIYKRQG